MKIELGEKSKYDSQFVHREFPMNYDYEPIRDLTQESVAHVLQSEMSLKTSN